MLSKRTNVTHDSGKPCTFQNRNMQKVVENIACSVIEMMCLPHCVWAASDDSERDLFSPAQASAISFLIPQLSETFVYSSMFSAAYGFGMVHRIANH